MLGKIEILSSSCNISTIRDGRGGFYLDTEDPLLEFNMLYFYRVKFEEITITLILTSISDSGDPVW